MIPWIGSLELGGKATREDDLLSGKNETVATSHKFRPVLHEFSLPLPIPSPDLLSPFFKFFWILFFTETLLEDSTALLISNPIASFNLHPMSSFCLS